MLVIKFKEHITSPILVLSLFFSLVFSARTENERPPSAFDLYQRFERLWSKRKYAELERDIGELQQKWKGYVPVELNLAIFCAYYGGQIEDSITILAKLHSQMMANIEVASPIFLDCLDSQMYRYQRATNFYYKNGFSREQRLAERHPLKKTTFTFPDHWIDSDDMLYYNVPEVFVSDEGFIPVSFDVDRTQIVDLQRLDYKQLLTLIVAPATPTTSTTPAVSKAT